MKTGLRPKKRFRFDTAFESVYELNREGSAYIHACSFLGAGILKSDSLKKMEKKTIEHLESIECYKNDESE